MSDDSRLTWSRRPCEVISTGIPQTEYQKTISSRPRSLPKFAKPNSPHASRYFDPFLSRNKSDTRGQHANQTICTPQAWQAWLGKAGVGTARLGRPVMVRLGAAWHGMVRRGTGANGSITSMKPVAVWPGEARQGKVRHGCLRHIYQEAV